MSSILITIIIAGVVVSSAFIMRWQRHNVLARICPREILFLKSAEERHRVHGRGLNSFLLHWSTWIAFIAYAVALAVPSVLASAGLLTIAETRVGQRSVTGVKVGAILCAVLPQFYLIPLMYARYRKWMRVFLREYLNDHGTPICQNCGYDLRGQVSRACPECGTACDGKTVADDKGQ